MTVESNCAITIATLSHWLKTKRHFFNQWEAKPKPLAPPAHDLRKRAAYSCCDGRSNYFGNGFYGSQGLFYYKVFAAAAVVAPLTPY